MIDPDTEQFIIRALAAGHRREDLIGPVCQRAGLNWSEASDAITAIQDRETKAITGKQRWRGRLLGMSTLMVGILFTKMGATGITKRPFLVIKYTPIPHPVLFIMLGAGILMIIGGIIGIMRGR